MTCTIDDCDRLVLARGMCRMHYLREYRTGSTDATRGGSVEDRFWRKVKRGADGECWRWTGQTETRMGYGRVHVGGRGSPRVFAHRVSYEIHCGPIPEGMSVLHRCDNPPCTNPAHLFLGTVAENIADMDAKGRRVVNRFQGVEHPKAKLTEDDVKAIRASSETHAELSRRYGVNANSIIAIRNRRNWSHI